MVDRSELEALLGRVENATGPDRELDTAIGEMFAVHSELGTPSSSGFWHAPKLTASVDAALALVERCLPGWWWHAGLALGAIGDGPHAFTFKIYQPADPECTRLTEHYAIGRTFPLAILHAMLKALLASHPAEPLKHMPA